MKYGLEVLSAIDGKLSRLDIVLITEFVGKDFGEYSGSRRKEVGVKLVVRCWIASDEQPKLLVVVTNHCFIDRNVIRSPTGFWL